MKKPAKKTKAKTPKKLPKPIVVRPDGLRAGSKQAIMLDLAMRPEGVTEKALLKRLAWVKCRVTLNRVCAKVGVELSITKDAKGAATFRATKAPAPAETAPTAPAEAA